MTKQAIRHVDYDAKEKAGTENHLSVDEQMDEVINNTGGRQQNAFEEGFGASSGVRSQTAESGGKVKHPEAADRARTGVDSGSVEKINPADDENAGLADN